MDQQPYALAQAPPVSHLGSPGRVAIFSGGGPAGLASPTGSNLLMGLARYDVGGEPSAAGPAHPAAPFSPGGLLSGDPVYLPPSFLQHNLDSSSQQAAPPPAKGRPGRPKGVRNGAGRGRGRGRGKAAAKAAARPKPGGAGSLLSGAASGSTVTRREKKSGGRRNGAGLELAAAAVSSKQQPQQLANPASGDVQMAAVPHDVDSADLVSGDGTVAAPRVGKRGRTAGQGGRKASSDGKGAAKRARTARAANPKPPAPPRNDEGGLRQYADRIVHHMRERKTAEFSVLAEILVKEFRKIVEEKLSMSSLQRQKKLAEQDAAKSDDPSPPRSPQQDIKQEADQQQQQSEPLTTPTPPDGAIPPTPAVASDAKADTVATAEPVATSTPSDDKPAPEKSSESQEAPAQGSTTGKTGPKAAVKKEEDKVAKNITTRVYDAVNVLVALDIIARDGGVLTWKGMPTVPHSAEQARLLQRKKQLEERLADLRGKLADLQSQTLQFRSLSARNKSRPEPGPGQAIHLPFIVVHAPVSSEISCEFVDDHTEYSFDFETPFQILDDAEVLRLMDPAKVRTVPVVAEAPAPAPVVGDEAGLASAIVGADAGLAPTSPDPAVGAEPQGEAQEQAQRRSVLPPEVFPVAPPAGV